LKKQALAFLITSSVCHSMGRRSFTYRTHLTFSYKGWTVKPDNMSNWPQNQPSKIRLSCFSFKLGKRMPTVKLFSRCPKKKNPMDQKTNYTTCFRKLATSELVRIEVIRSEHIWCCKTCWIPKQSFQLLKFN
jgi:hypothetical protein